MDEVAQEFHTQHVRSERCDGCRGRWGLLRPVLGALVVPWRDDSMRVAAIILAAM